MTRSSHSAGQKDLSLVTRPVTVPVAGSALLLVDVINDLNFEGSQALIAQAESMATRLAVLKRRASAAGVTSALKDGTRGGLAALSRIEVM